MTTTEARALIEAMTTTTNFSEFCSAYFGVIDALREYASDILTPVAAVDELIEALHNLENNRDGLFNDALARSYGAVVAECEREGLSDLLTRSRLELWAVTVRGSHLLSADNVDRVNRLVG
jgi:hypothetical protein